MKTINTRTLAFPLLIIVSIVGIETSSLALEKAKYVVLEKLDSYELRQYEPRIVAETLVEGDFEDVGNEGFRRLYDYISGKNRKKLSISMTAPVTQESESEKIAMTAPVNQQQVGQKWRITFLMPAKYTLQTLPEPLDSRVILKLDPAVKAAVLRYSGTWSKKRYEEHRSRLELLIQQYGLQPAGSPVWARYDPPFQLWFLRRNEVLIPVR